MCASSSATLVAVQRLNLEIADGEFFSIIGPSGCGKTTTLRMIAGFEQPTSGTISVSGRDVTNVRPVPAPGQHGVPELRAVPAPRRVRERRVRPARGQAPGGGDPRARGRSDRARAARRAREGAAAPALRRPAAARRARPRGRQPARGAAARRAAGRARPQAARRHADGAQGSPARARDHVLLRHPRSVRGVLDVRPRRRHERRAARAGRRPRGGLPPPASAFVADFVGAANQLAATVAARAGDGRYRVAIAGCGERPVAGPDGLAEGERRHRRRPSRGPQRRARPTAPASRRRSSTSPFSAHSGPCASTLRASGALVATTRGDRRGASSAARR